MSRFAVAAVRSVRTLSGLILVAASVFLSSPALFAGGTTAAPQLLPYTVSVVAGGGTLGISTAKYTVGDYCGTNTTSPPTGTPPAPLTSWPTATDTVGDGCLATQVNLYVSTSKLPRAAAADSEGNVFFIDDANLLIRRVDAHTGIVTTYAGTTSFAVTVASGYITANPNPSSGENCSSTDTTHQSIDYYGDGCLATEVALASPEALAIDPQGNVWFSDYAMGAVRKINKGTGIISTIVNTASALTAPSTTVQGQGYKADNVAYTKSGITAAMGELENPYGLTFDQQGNLYIADEYNSVVDAVNLGSAAITIAGILIPAGEIYTIAGVGCPYVTSTSGCHTGSKGGYYGTTPTGTNTLAATSALLYYPYQVAVDNSGNIYIDDEYNYAVRVINSSGTLSNFVNDAFSSSTTALARGPALTTKLQNPYGVATDSLGNLYIANYYSATPFGNYIARVDQATGEIYAIAGEAPGAAPTGPGVAPLGATYCAGKTDALGDGCSGSQATFWHPYFPSIDAAGNVYVDDAYNGLIRKISVGTQFHATAVGSQVTQNIDVHFGAGDSPIGTSPSYIGAFTLPSGFADFTLGTPTCTPNDDTTMDITTTDCVLSVTFNPSQPGVRSAPLTVTNTSTNTSGHVFTFSLIGTGLAPVLAVDPGVQSTLAPSASATAPLTGINSIALDNGNNVYATVANTNPVVMIPSTGVGSTLSSGTASANAVTVDGAGNIYVALSNGAIMELPGGVAASATQVAGGFTTPSGLAVDSYGNIYVSDSGAKSVTKIIAGTGAQTILATNASADLSHPAGLAVDSYGNVFVADSVANLVFELSFNGSAAVELGSGLDAPAGVAVDPAGSLYIADGKNSRIVFIPNESTALNPSNLNTADQIAIITNAQLATPLGTPSGVAVAGNGTVYVADSSNNAIYTFVRTSASFNFGGVATDAPPPTVPADIISMGTEPATFSSTFWTENSNSTYFSLTPSTIPSASYFPDAGYGVSLTATFTPLAVQSGLSAVYTFGATNVTAPTLTLSGSGQLHGSDQSTLMLSAPPPAGQSSWIYGQTVTLDVTESVTAGLPTPTGNVIVTIGTAQGT
ncbi:MAG: hypothetical protein ABSD72_17150 [Terracidiphilus sp.]